MDAWSEAESKAWRALEDLLLIAYASGIDPVEVKRDIQQAKDLACHVWSQIDKVKNPHTFPVS
jgi:hypothetical protein